MEATFFMNEILSIDGLSKSYGSVQAVSSLHLKLNQGEVLGLLGPNGSGKTTTLGMLLGVTRPNAGSYSWFGQGQGAEQRLRIGALLETPNFYPYLSATENLKIISKIKQVDPSENERLIEMVGLGQRSQSLFRTFSLGMKQRLAIAAAMVGNPDVLILDEPANGLDPQGIAEVRHTIAEIASQGKTILMASHILDEVEKVCSHVAILKKGKLLASGPVGGLLGDLVLGEVGAENTEALRRFLSTVPSCTILKEKGSYFEIQMDDDIDGAKLNAMAHSQGIQLNHLVIKKRSLESEFLEITTE